MLKPGGSRRLARVFSNKWMMMNDCRAKFPTNLAWGERGMLSHDHSQHSPHLKETNEGTSVNTAVSVVPDRSTPPSQEAGAIARTGKSLFGADRMHDSAIRTPQRTY